MDALAPSELILNPDGSIYHLNLIPEQLAQTIILVGDPDRVPLLTQHFDRVEIRMQKREFHTQTGELNGRRISVVSTGIGTDNIDIVLNELDALANINFTTRQVREKLVSLEIIRIGTSGSIQPDIQVDSFLLSELAAGFDSLLHYYDSRHVQMPEMTTALEEHLELNGQGSRPYVVSCDSGLAEKFKDPRMISGFTDTNAGFYGPQGRVLRLALRDDRHNSRLASFHHKGHRITNLEMETSGIYGLASLLGHKAVSLNAIIANRTNGTFTKRGNKTVEELIAFALERLTA